MRQKRRFLDTILCRKAAGGSLFACGLYGKSTAGAVFQVWIITRFWFRHSLGDSPYIFLKAREK